MRWRTTKNDSKKEQEDKIRNMLIEKIKNDGGDEKFVDTLMRIYKAEDDAANKSKKEYFKIESAVIWVSMFSSIMAGISAIDISVWSSAVPERARIWINILVTVLSIALPAVITMLVAYRGVKRSYETWIRHRKYSMAMETLINNYLYGNEEFDRLCGIKAYWKFRNEIQELWKGSMAEFLRNMNK